MAPVGHIKRDVPSEAKVFCILCPKGYKYRELKKHLMRAHGVTTVDIACTVKDAEGRSCDWHCGCSLDCYLEHSRHIHREFFLDGASYVFNVANGFRLLKGYQEVVDISDSSDDEDDDAEEIERGDRTFNLKDGVDLLNQLDRNTGFEMIINQLGNGDMRLGGKVLLERVMAATEICAVEHATLLINWQLKKLMDSEAAGKTSK